MLTKTKKRANRWQALALAALMLAGGSIAVPQAADAATSVSQVKSLGCGFGDTYCTYKVQVYKRQANYRTIYVKSPLLDTSGIRYAVVDLTHSKVRCTGKFGSGASSILCKIPNRTARLEIRTVKSKFQLISMNAEIR
ncbi:MAG: hypothetical protein IJG47_16510 [Microbacterium sp.]|nr:hypothetical protein [Microbacterium sp.]